MARKSFSTVSSFGALTQTNEPGRHLLTADGKICIDLNPYYGGSKRQTGTQVGCTKQRGLIAAPSSSGLFRSRRRWGSISPRWQSSALLLLNNLLLQKRLKPKLTCSYRRESLTVAGAGAARIPEQRVLLHSYGLLLQRVLLRFVGGAPPHEPRHRHTAEEELPLPPERTRIARQGA